MDNLEFCFAKILVSLILIFVCLFVYFWATPNSTQKLLPAGSVDHRILVINLRLVACKENALSTVLYLWSTLTILKNKVLRNSNFVSNIYSKTISFSKFMFIKILCHVFLFVCLGDLTIFGVGLLLSLSSGNTPIQQSKQCKGCWVSSLGRLLDR